MDQYVVFIPMTQAKNSCKCMIMVNDQLQERENVWF